jgi:hypothetical protein
MATAIERIEQAERRLQELEARQAGSHQFAERALGAAMNTETATGVLGKTLTALIYVMKDKHLVQDHEILERMQKMDEDEDKRQITAALQKKAITVAEVSGPASIVVVKHIMIPTEDPKPITISAYRVVELPAAMTPPATREAMSGKKVGETAKLSGPGGDNLFTFLEIYDIANVEQKGEAAESSQNTGAEQQPAAENQEAT